MDEVEKELHKKKELESRFERLKEKEEELIRLFENSNNHEKQTMNELKSLLYGSKADEEMNMGGSTLKGISNHR